MTREDQRCRRCPATATVDESIRLYLSRFSIGRDSNQNLSEIKSTGCDAEKVRRQSRLFRQLNQNISIFQNSGINPDGSSPHFDRTQKSLGVIDVVVKARDMALVRIRQQPRRQTLRTMIQQVKRHEATTNEINGRLVIFERAFSSARKKHDETARGNRSQSGYT